MWNSYTSSRDESLAGEGGDSVPSPNSPISGYGDEQRKGPDHIAFHLEAAACLGSTCRKPASPARSRAVGRQPGQARARSPGISENRGRTTGHAKQDQLRRIHPGSGPVQSQSAPVSAKAPHRLAPREQIRSGRFRSALLLVAGVVGGLGIATYHLLSSPSHPAQEISMVTQDGGIRDATGTPATAPAAPVAVSPAATAQDGEVPPQALPAQGTLQDSSSSQSRFEAAPGQSVQNTSAPLAGMAHGLLPSGTGTNGTDGIDATTTGTIIDRSSAAGLESSRQDDVAKCPPAVQAMGLCGASRK